MKNDTMWVLVAVLGAAGVAYYLNKKPKQLSGTTINPSTGAIVPAMAVVTPQTTVGKLITGATSLLNSTGWV